MRAATCPVTNVRAIGRRRWRLSHHHVEIGYSIKLFVNNNHLPQTPFEHHTNVNAKTYRGRQRTKSHPIDAIVHSVHDRRGLCYSCFPRTLDTTEQHTMAPARVRLVRREPLMTRLKNYLNPWDFLLWVSEELNSTDLEDIYKQWSIPIAILLNSIFMIARANSVGGGGASSADDVFGDYQERRGSGWLLWFVSEHGSSMKDAREGLIIIYRQTSWCIP